MERKFGRRAPVRGTANGKPGRAPRKGHSIEGSSFRNEENGENRNVGRPRRNFGERSFGERKMSGERRSYGGRKSFGDRPYRERNEGERTQERPQRSFGGRKPYGGDRPSGEWRGYGDRNPFGDRRQSGGRTGFGERPYRERKEESGRPDVRPERSYGEKSYGGRKSFGGDRTSGGRKSYGDRKPYGEKRDRFGRGEHSERRNYGKRAKVDVRSSEETPETAVRLNKFIANSGVCSRREADTFIQTGLVSVNGKIVTELGTKVTFEDDVRFNGERLKGERKVYIVMNKPKDFVTTVSDPHAERTVMDLISKEMCPERVFPVGRLDRATTGVLLFTNDGSLTERLTHPSHGVKKIYHAFLDKNLKQTDFDAILEGMELEDGEIHADTLSYVDGDKTQVGLEIHSGRNRIVRRIFEHLGYKVKKLDRVYFAGLTKKNLSRGEWRFLTSSEVDILNMSTSSK